MPDFTLFSAPGTCARIPLISLEEAGADYELRLVRFMKGEHKASAFLKLNPKGKVPLLLVGDEPLSENVAIARYLAVRFPQAGLLPVHDDPLQDARVTADLAFCAATLHPLVSLIRMAPMRVDGAEAAASLRAKSIEAITPLAEMIDRRVAEGTWWYGDSWSVIDAYVFWAYARITPAGFPGTDFPAWTDHVTRMENRPAVQRAMALEAEMEAQLQADGAAFTPR